MGKLEGKLAWKILMIATPQFDFRHSTWQSTVLFALGFWLSGSLILDLLIMPSLYGSGIMKQPDFVIAGYSIFWLFNRFELLCGALILTGLLALRHQRNRFSIIANASKSRWPLFLSLLLFAIALIYTYILTPDMSSLGLQLNLFESGSEVPAGMNQLHGLYWGLELMKLAAGGILFRFCYREAVSSL